LNVDLDWIHVFLSNAKISSRMLLDFLQAFSQVIDEVMGSEGDFIVEWLQLEIERLDVKEKF